MDAGFLTDFLGLLNDATLRSVFDPWLSVVSLVGIAVIAAGVARVTGPIGATAVGAALAGAHQALRVRTDSLTLFLQKIRVQSRDPDEAGD
jgi:hypothetical protein